MTDLLDRISIDPQVCGGKPCVVGTRIRVWDVAVLAQSGHSPDEILVHYPSLTLADNLAEGRGARDRAKRGRLGEPRPMPRAEAVMVKDGCP